MWTPIALEGWREGDGGTKIDKPITTCLRLEDGSEGGIGMSSYASD
jgi:hypothetical protein